MVMTKSRLICVVLFLISAILLFPAISHSQSFQYRKAITIDHTLVPAGLTNLPVLISISNDNDLRDHVTSANGYDLVFTDVGGSQLEMQSQHPSDGFEPALVGRICRKTGEGLVSARTRAVYPGSNVVVKWKRRPQAQ